MSLRHKTPYPVKTFGGLNLNFADGDIQDYQSPDCLNCITYEIGSKEQRPGQLQQFTNLGAGKINGMFNFNDILFAHGTKLYKWDGTATTQLYDELTDANIRAVELDNVLYLLNGHEYIQYNGTTVAPVTAYQPTQDEIDTYGQNELSISASSITENEKIAVYTNRIVMAINNTLWFSHRYSPGYFPSPQFILIGSSREEITGIKPFYNYLAVFKENSIYVIVGDLTNNPQDFEVRPINDTIGCINGDTIRLVDNFLIFLAEDGVRKLLGSTVKEYLNTEKVNNNIDALLQRHTDEEKRNAKSAKWLDYYILTIGNMTYCLDTRTNEWDVWDNINANCYLTVGNDLYSGDRTNGIINKFDKENLNDNGAAINQYWKTKRFYITRLEEIKKFYGLRIDFEISHIRSNSTVKVWIDDEIYIEDITNIQKFIIGLSRIGEGTITRKERTSGEIDISENGSYIQYIIENNNIDERFKIYGYAFYYKRKKVK